MKSVIRLFLATGLLLSATSSFAWFGNNNNGWNNGYNQYDEWDPRYWMDEMEDMFDDNDYYGGPGPYGPPPGYYGPPPGYYGPNGPARGPYGPPPGYVPPQYNNAPNAGPRPYGPPPGYRPNYAPRPHAPQGSAPQGSNQ